MPRIKEKSVPKSSSALKNLLDSWAVHLEVIFLFEKEEEVRFSFEGSTFAPESQISTFSTFCRFFGFSPEERSESSEEDFLSFRERFDDRFGIFGS